MCAKSPLCMYHVKMASQGPGSLLTISKMDFFSMCVIFMHLLSFKLFFFFSKTDFTNIERELCYYWGKKTLDMEGYLLEHLSLHSSQGTE